MLLFFVIFFLLGLAFGYAAGWPWGLLAFVIPLLLVLAAADRSVVAIVVGFIITAGGLVAGFMLASRERARERQAT
jgi:hypothetical protein